jgi:hypothetical protein
MRVEVLRCRGGSDGLQTAPPKTLQRQLKAFCLVLQALPPPPLRPLLPPLRPPSLVLLLLRLRLL